MRAHRGHTGTAADKHHFRVGIFGKELTKRAGDRYLIARLQGPDVRRHDARRGIRHVRRWRGNTHVEHNNALLFRVVGHRVGTQRRLFHLRHKAEKIEFVPVGTIRLRHVKVRIRHGVRRTFNLNVSPGAERDIFPFRHPQLQLFNKGGFVIIRDNLALPFFDAENFLRQLNFHVLTHRDLAGQTAALFCLTFGDMRQLGWQNIATALFYRHAALPAGAAAAAC